MDSTFSRHRDANLHSAVDRSDREDLHPHSTFAHSQDECSEPSAPYPIRVKLDGLPPRCQTAMTAGIEPSSATCTTRDQTLISGCSIEASTSCLTSSAVFIPGSDCTIVFLK